MISDYLQTGGFLTITILLIINFVFLFKRNTSYISWIIGFVLFVIYPFTWIGDVLKYSKLSNTTGTKVFYWGTILSLIIAIAFEITTLIIVIMTNDFFRKNRGEQDENSEANDDKQNKMIRQNTIKIKIMYTTVVALIIGMVINLFFVFSKGSKLDRLPGDVSIIGHEPNPVTKKSKPETGEFIKQMIEFIPSKVNEFENMWSKIMNGIMAPRLLKAFFLFCAGFLIPFFTIFVKVSNDTLHYDVFFPPIFYTNIKSPVYFVFLALMLSLVVTFLAVWLAYTVKSFFPENDSFFIKHAVTSTGILSFIVCIAVFISIYLLKMEHVMEYVYILISFCFALLGTPITFGVLDLFARLLNKSLVFEKTVPTETVQTETVQTETGPENIIRKETNVILFCIFVSYWLGIFIGGKKWITNLSDKKLAMILVTIICMTIGVFLGLSSYYKVFTNLFSAIMIFVRTILTFLGPPAIISLSASQIYLANQSFRNKNKTTDDVNFR